MLSGNGAWASLGRFRTPSVQFSMTLEEAQQRVDGWIKDVGVRYFSELTNLAQLVEEVGEVARVISREYGEQSYKESDRSVNLADELADVLFVVICLANQTGVDLTAALDGLVTLDAMVKGVPGHESDTAQRRLAFLLWVREHVAARGVGAVGPG